MSGMSPSVAVLLGDDHEELGDVGLAELSPQLAGALSRGKYPKGYRYVDPNEDGVLVAAGDGAVLAAVADGHAGFDAARTALAAVAEDADRIVADGVTDPEGSLLAAAGAALRAVRAAAPTWSRRRRRSATTLTLGLLAGGEGCVVSYGDSVAVLCSGRAVRMLNAERPFLDERAETGESSVATFGYRPGDRFVVCSDGVVDFLGRKWDRRLCALAGDAATAAGLATALVEEAFVGGAGDNVAVAAVLC